MKIDRHLRLVMEIPRDNAPPVLIHSEALPIEIFEQYFDICGPTYNALLTGGYGYTAPRYAALVFRKTAISLLGPEPAVPNEAWSRAKAATEARVKAFFDELHRLTYVLTLKNGRWDMVLIDDAREAIDSEELSRIDAALTYFTVASQSVPREIMQWALGGLSLFSARTESSSCTDFMRSLPTSIKVESSGESEDSLPQSSNGLQVRDSSGSSPATSAPGRARPPFAIAISSVSRG